MRRRWFSFGRRLVQTIIPQGTGTAVGGMTSGGGLAAAFDGNTNQAGAASALNSSLSSGFTLANSVGKNWGSTKTISRFVATGPNNSNSFISSGTNRNYRLVGSNSNDPTTATILKSGTTGSGSPSLVLDVSTGIDTSTAYQYHWFMVEGNGANDVIVCELVFYELA